MTTATRGMLTVSGAALHYQLRGKGPLLLISQSGEGDADRSNDLVAHLADGYTVVTYDRRGLEQDFTAVIRDTLDVTALKCTPTRIIPAVGTTTPAAVFDYQCALALAELTGIEVRRLPGGHNGNTTHPRAYAARIRDLLLRPPRNHRRTPLYASIAGNRAFRVVRWHLPHAARRRRNAWRSMSVH